MSNQLQRIDGLRNTIVASVYSLAKQEIFINSVGQGAANLAAVEAWNVKNLLTLGAFPTKSESERNAKLLECSPESWQKVVFDAVILGLSLNPIKKHCAVVPYGNTVTLMPMVGGYIHLMYGNNIIKSCSYNAVYSNDTFHMRQPLLPETVAQNFIFEKNKKGRGEFIGAYAFFTLQNGQFIGDFLDKEQIEKRKNSAKTKDIWNAWFDEMVEKTIVHYVKKQIPATTKMLQLDQFEYQHIDLETLKKIESNVPIVIDEAESATPEVLAEIKDNVEPLDFEQKLMFFKERKDWHINKDIVKLFAEMCESRREVLAIQKSLTTQSNTILEILRNAYKTAA